MYSIIGVYLRLHPHCDVQRNPLVSSYHFLWGVLAEYREHEDVQGEVYAWVI